MDWKRALTLEKLKFVDDTFGLAPIVVTALNVIGLFAITLGYAALFAIGWGGVSIVDVCRDFMLAHVPDYDKWITSVANATSLIGLFVLARALYFYTTSLPSMVRLVREAYRQERLR